MQTGKIAENAQTMISLEARYANEQSRTEAEAKSPAQSQSLSTHLDTVASEDAGLGRHLVLVELVEHRVAAR